MPPTLIPTLLSERVIDINYDKNLQLTPLDFQSHLKKNI